MPMLLRVNGLVEEYPPRANGTDYSLLELSQAIGGAWIEVIYLSDGDLMIVDEEGKLKGRPINWMACLMTRDVLHPEELVLGDALVINPDQVL